ncbi:MAG: hypothetical protein M3P94_01450, partial [Chloroflexota bacterium]|nr:hypothetical protein [Chloroflexota bacterium]
PGPGPGAAPRVGGSILIDDRPYTLVPAVVVTPAEPFPTAPTAPTAPPAPEAPAEPGPIERLKPLAGTILTNLGNIAVTLALGYFGIRRARAAMRAR